MTYGTVDGLEILLKMIIDDGNPERTNRYNVFNPDHVFFGQYSGSHDSEGH
jgi:hypothetical protein